VWVVDATKDRRRRALREPWVPVQEGKERKLTLALDRGNSAGLEVTGLGVSKSKI
jgi:hypothetical protein